ncbi:MAG TPA: UDP-glucuronosyltransferase [Terriglobia bacterium]|nr:UDP-glucuronosyltransferase [Terriglobia bacterium]
MTPKPPPVTILTSGVGLGVYIPALLIQRQLLKRQCPTTVEVLERYYTPAQRTAHLAHRRAFQEDFALAQLAHRMVRDVQESLDSEGIRLLLEGWLNERRVDFIVWSGFWLPVIERYRQLSGGAALHVDHCRIDAEISASFRIYPELVSCGNAVWLWNWAQRKIIHEIPVMEEEAIPFCNREDRLIVHGGGWGIGTYQSRIPELQSTRYSLSVVVHDVPEAGRRVGDRYFMLNPSWETWTVDADGEHEFPPMGELAGPSFVKLGPDRDVHALHHIIRTSKAVISKPGGCTLIDSLASATPLVFLEPYGYAEESNAKIWELLGFGISYAAWRDTGYDTEVLERLHMNIVSRAQRGVDYPRAILERNLQGVGE